jgi:ketosteroid isomerase-like protein
MVLFIVVGLLRARHIAAFSSQGSRSAEHDRTAIETLHRQIIEATLSGQADQITTLWDADGVRLTQGRPPEIGRAIIDADNKSGRAAHPEWKTIYYQPKIEDQQIAGDWASEWGTFETAHRESAKGGEVALHGTFLRVLKRQDDGSWKLARVMMIESAK